jgi:hypothetical protein
MIHSINFIFSIIIEIIMNFVPPVPTFDPVLILSVILIQIGARHLDLELTDFQKKILKNKLIQAIILFGLIYIPVRDVKKALFIVLLIYLMIYVIFNENHNYNLFSKRYLYKEGIIKEFNDMKEKYYNNISNLF